MGSRGREDSRGLGGTQTGGDWRRLAETGGVWDERAGSLTTSRPCGPTLDSGWWRTGQAEAWVAPRSPTFARRYKPGRTVGAKQTA